jgi:hypothetical protein
MYNEHAQAAGTLMQSKKLLVVGLRVLAVCAVFAVCMAVGGALSGLDRVAQQGAPAQSPSQAPAQTAQLTQASPQSAPAQPGSNNLLFPFLTLSICVGVTASYLILRSSWHGWTLAGAMFVGMYGISTVVTQIESVVFLSSKMPHGMLRAIFAQGAISGALFAPAAVLLLGKWKAAGPVSPAHAHMGAASAAWKIALLTLAFVFLYMLFGYYVAWQNPELRAYYGGPAYPTFLDALKGNWRSSPWIFPLAAFRALLYIAFLYPLVRMLRVRRWESAMAIALFLAAWTTLLLLPNPLMPPSVAHSHFRETLGFSLVFGMLTGWLLNTSPSSIAGAGAGTSTLGKPASR